MKNICQMTFCNTNKPFAQRISTTFASVYTVTWSILKTGVSLVSIQPFRFFFSILLTCISSLSHTSVYPHPAPLRDLFIALLLFIQPDNTFIFLLSQSSLFFALHCAYSQSRTTFSLFNECQNLSKLRTYNSTRLKNDTEMKDLFSVCCLLHCKHNKSN